MDIDLTPKQKVLDASTIPMSRRTIRSSACRPTSKEGQTLEQARDLLLAEVDEAEER